MSTTTVTASKNFVGEASEGEGGLVKRGATLTVTPQRAAQLRSLGWADPAADVPSAKTASPKRSTKEDKAATERKTKADDPPADDADRAPVEVKEVGGGWYEIVVAGVTIEKVQGKEEAEKAAEHARAARKPQ